MLYTGVAVLTRYTCANPPDVVVDRQTLRPRFSMRLQRTLAQVALDLNGVFVDRDGLSWYQRSFVSLGIWLLVGLCHYG